MCVCAQLLSCVQLCDPMDYSPPGSSVHGNFQARTLEWGAISSEISWTHGLKPCLLRLLHWQEDALPLSHQGILN